ncbi:MAG: hypothetical protein AAF682_28500 [Planctomycetota bacterium]
MDTPPARPPAFARARSLARLALLTLASSSCGYFAGGEWSDDPANWERAFRTPQPAGADVLHSYYTRSGHWSYEFEGYFALAPNDALCERIIADNALERLADEPAEWYGRPAWFRPKPAAAYEAWGPRAETLSQLRLLVDRDSGRLFLYDAAF